MRNTHSTLRLFARFFVLSALILAFTGCTGIRYTEVDEELGQVSWANMQDLSGKARDAAGPFNASLSFRLKTPSEGLMLGAYVWSNGRVRSHQPLRLDLQSSVGSTVAKIKEESDYFLLYDLKNNTAVISRSPQEALSTIGMLLPFSLSDISLLINGHYLHFFNQGDNTRPQLSATTKETHSVFRISSGPRQGYLTLNSRGYPVSWRSDNEKKSWSMSMSYQDVAAIVANVTPLPGPSRLNIEHPDGYSISINVKSLKKFPIPFTPAQLELLIPSSAEVRELTEQPKGK